MEARGAGRVFPEQCPAQQGRSQGFLSPIFWAQGQDGQGAVGYQGKGNCSAASEQALAVFCRVSSLWMHKGLWIRESCSSKSSNSPS